MADSTITQRIKELGAQVEPYVIEQRRKFHTHPELGFEETWTTEEIARELDAMGVPYERPLETGVVATIKGAASDAYRADGTPQRRIALRADIDALPVQEMTGVP